MNEIIEAQKALKEYSVAQERLCAALFEKYGVPGDRLLANIPPGGLLSLDGEAWQFRKHGLGVLFEQLSNHLILDVHRHIQVCPTCFDTWRLVQYFESKNILSLNVGSKVFSTQDERSLAEMLGELVRTGALVLRSDIEAFALA
jgi:hypothetical protein